MNTTDIHSHMFNLKYLPVAGILRRYSDEKIPLPIARGVERLLIRKTGSSFETEPKNFFKELFGKFKNIFKKHQPQERIQDLIKNPDFKLFSWSKEQILKNFSQQLDLDDLKDPVISDALNKFREVMGKKYINFEAAAKSGKNTDDVIDLGNKEFNDLLEFVFEQIEKAQNLKEKGLNFARWFSFMMNKEEDIFKRVYEQDSVGVSRCIHLTMDVHSFFDEKSGTQHHAHFDYETQQLPNMAKLDQKHPEKLYGFVAFNPSRENGVQIVKDAINKGFKGVKFYPPLGYRAAEDRNPVFEKRIKELFTFCVEKDIPVFSHCNNKGFEAYPKGDFHYPGDTTPSGYNSNPKYWAKALEQFPTLRLCLAHGGGTEGWFAPNLPTDFTKAAQIRFSDVVDDSKAQEEDWNCSYAAMVFKLCVERENVYCDAAYLDDLVNSAGTYEEPARTRFENRLLALFASEPKFANRIIYGSDWHMLFQEGKNETYFKTYQNFYSATGVFKNFHTSFFEGNAKGYLGF